MTHQRKRLINKIYNKNFIFIDSLLSKDEIYSKRFLSLDELAFEMDINSKHLKSNPKDLFVFKEQFPQYVFGENRELRFDE